MTRQISGTNIFKVSYLSQVHFLILGIGNLNICEGFPLNDKYRKSTCAEHNGETVTSLPLTLQPVSISKLFLFVLKCNWVWKLLHLKADVNVFKKPEEYSSSESWEM